MSTAADQALIAVEKLGPLTSARAPAVVRGSAADHADPKEPEKGRSWKACFHLASLLLAVVAGVVVYQPWHRLMPSSVAAEGEAAHAPVRVAIARPSPAGSTDIVLPATFRPWQTATLRARVSGYLTAWHGDLGSPVKAGELLAEIETPELDQELAEGQALAREGEAALLQAQAERIEAQAELDVAKAQLLRAQAEHELAKSLLVRREKLLKSRIISQEEYDIARRQTDARSADVAAAQSDVDRRSSSLTTRAAVITAREATASSRLANVERLKELQRFKRIVAPFDGVIARREAEVGTLVTADHEALFVINDISRIRVQINVPQTYAMHTSPGLAATISLPESTALPIRGEITRIAESVDAASRTMLAEIELENRSHRFQPGSYAQVTLAMPHSNSAWTIPTNALLMRVEGPHVVVVNDQSETELRPVTLGRDLGERVVVANGIRGGERLVVNPRDDLVGGVPVQINHRDEPTSKLAQTR